MGLPSPQQLQDLSGLVLERNRICRGKWDKFKSVLGSIMMKLGPSAAQSGVTQAVNATTGLQSGAAISVAGAAGVTVAPIGAVLAPWIAVALIAKQAGTIFSLHDLKEAAAARGSGATSVRYTCNCGKCFENIKYIVDKKERNVGLVAVGVFTLGASAILKGVHSIGKKVSSAIKGEQRPKELVCRGLIASARENGCTTAIATIFLLSGSWTMFGDRDVKTMAKATAIITSEDGWEQLKSDW